MDEAHERAVETGRRNRERRKAKEAQKRAALEQDKPLVLEALRATLTATDTSARDRLFAVIALDEIMGYGLIPYKAIRIVQDEDSALIAAFAERLETYQKKDS